jgi:hypothetical protein
MTNASEGGTKKDGHERITFRVEPDYNMLLDAVAAYLITDKSKLIRMALDYYVDHHEDKLSPRLLRRWKDWREHHGRAGI